MGRFSGMTSPCSSGPQSLPHDSSSYLQMNAFSRTTPPFKVVNPSIVSESFVTPHEPNGDLDQSQYHPKEIKARTDQVCIVCPLGASANGYGPELPWGRLGTRNGFRKSRQVFGTEALNDSRGLGWSWTQHMWSSAYSRVAV